MLVRDVETIKKKKKQKEKEKKREKKRDLGLQTWCLQRNVTRQHTVHFKYFFLLPGVSIQYRQTCCTFIFQEKNKMTIKKNIT